MEKGGTWKVSCKDGLSQQNQEWCDASTRCTLPGGSQILFPVTHLAQFTLTMLACWLFLNPLVTLLSHGFAQTLLPWRCYGSEAIKAVLSKLLHTPHCHTLPSPL